MLKHLLMQHSHLLFSQESSQGLENRKRLHRSTYQKQPLILSLQDGKHLHCCLACSAGVSKESFAWKHFPACQEAHAAKLNELAKKYPVEVEEGMSEGVNVKVLLGEALKYVMWAKAQEATWEKRLAALEQKVQDRDPGLYSEIKEELDDEPDVSVKEVMDDLSGLFLQREFLPGNIKMGVSIPYNAEEAIRAFEDAQRKAKK